MKNLLFIFALVLILAWSIGFIGYDIGGLFHILLVLALISAVSRIILEIKSVRKYSYRVKLTD